MSESHTNRPHRDRLASLLLAITAPLSEEELALAPVNAFVLPVATRVSNAMMRL